MESPALSALHVWPSQVLIPCYTEGLELVKATVLAAASAQLPLGCSKKTVWLLDDGNSASKEAWVAGLGLPDVRYVNNRIRSKGRVSKSLLTP